MGYLADRVASTEAMLRHYDPDTVAKVVDSLPEPTLLSGPAHPAGYVHGLAMQVVRGEVVTWCAAAALGLAIAGWVVSALGMNRYPRTAGMAGLAGTSLALAAAVAFIGGTIYGGTAWDEGRHRTGGGYVVTASRVVLLDGTGGRSDIPASSVGRIDRRADGTLTLSNQRGYTILEVPPGTPDRASVDAAYAALGAAFRPSAPVLEAVAR